MMKKLSWHFYLVCAVIMIAAVVLYSQFSRKTEYAYEMADLQTMRSAEAAALFLWRDSLPEEPVEYWFDSKTLQLMPITESMPDPYGIGTKKVGHTIKSYDVQTATLYEYSEREDYTDKILHVVVSNKDNHLNISMDWVPNT